VILLTTLAGFAPSRWRSVARAAEPAAISGLVLGAMFGLLDSIRRERGLRSGLFGAPPILDAVIVIAYFCLVVALGYAAARDTAHRFLAAATLAPWTLYPSLWLRRSPDDVARDRCRLKIIAAAALPSALLLYAMTASTLGVVGARADWYSAFLALVLVVPVLIGGLALGTAAATLGRAVCGHQIEEGAIRGVGGLLRFWIPVLGVYLFGEFLAVTQVSEVDGLHVADEILSGRYGVVIWSALLGGLTVPLLLLTFRRTRTVEGVGIAALLVLAGLLATRWHAVVFGALGHAHLPDARGGYGLWWADLGCTVATYALGAAVYLVLASRLRSRQA
jgi:molybdopterin-containing oxidoreductase family membrane subunit